MTDIGLQFTALIVVQKSTLISVRKYIVPKSFCTLGRPSSLCYSTKTVLNGVSLCVFLFPSTCDCACKYIVLSSFCPALVHCLVHEKLYNRAQLLCLTQVKVCLYLSLHLCLSACGCVCVPHVIARAPSSHYPRSSSTLRGRRLQLMN